MKTVVKSNDGDEMRFSDVIHGIFPHINIAVDGSKNRDESVIEFYTRTAKMLFSLGTHNTRCYLLYTDFPRSEESVQREIEKETNCTLVNGNLCIEIESPADFARYCGREFLYFDSTFYAIFTESDAMDITDPTPMGLRQRLKNEWSRVELIINSTPSCPLAIEGENDEKHLLISSAILDHQKMANAFLMAFGTSVSQGGEQNFKT
jgi:hypothetical protein